MRSDTTRLPLILAALVGGLALFVAGFIMAAEMRSAVASPAARANFEIHVMNADGGGQTGKR